MTRIHHSLFKLGSFRFVRRFAWLPVLIRPGLSIWLEGYQVKQQFVKNYALGYFDVYTGTGKWVDKENIVYDDNR